MDGPINREEMKMENASVTSLDQLNDLFDQGKISQDDYETLRKAMEANAAEEADRARSDSQKKRLRRSRSERILGGVCAGIGERFDIDPWKMQLVVGIGSLFLIVAMTLLFWILGFLLSTAFVVLLYSAFCLILPWDEATPPESSRPGVALEALRASRGFGVALAALALIILSTTRFIVPYVTSTFEDLGSALPPLTVVMINVSHWAFRSLLHFFLFGVALVTLFLLDVIMPRGKLIRRLYEWCVIVGMLIFLAVYLYSFYIAWQGLAERVVP